MIRLENAMKTSLQDKTPWRFFEDVLKTFLQDVLETSSKSLEGVLKISWRCFCKTSWRRLKNVLKTSWQDVLKMSCRRLEDVWPRRIYWSWSRRLLKTKTKCVFKMSPRRLHQTECFLGWLKLELVRTLVAVAACHLS